MLKQKQGVTLIALIITVIVLLILAGVSISLVVGNNGILTRAQVSSDETKMGKMVEAVGLAVSDCQSLYFNSFAHDASATPHDYFRPSKIDAALSAQGYRLYVSLLAYGPNSVIYNVPAGNPYNQYRNTDILANNDSMYTWGSQSYGSSIYFISDSGAKDYVALRAAYTEAGLKVNYAKVLNVKPGNTNELPSASGLSYNVYGN